MTALALAGRLVTTAGILDGGVLEVRLDGTIGYVGPASGWSGPVPEPVDTVAPGYVDIHCHGGGSHTVTSRDPAEVAAVAAHHLSRGTTTMLASLVSASTPELVAAITAIASVAATGSPVVGCHVEGPFLDPAHRGAHDPAHLRLPGSDELATWLAAGVDDAGRPRVRMVTLAPELPGAAAAAELLERSGIVVGLGHTGGDARGAHRGRRAPRRRDGAPGVRCGPRAARRTRQRRDGGRRDAGRRLRARVRTGAGRGRPGVDAHRAAVARGRHFARRRPGPPLRDAGRRRSRRRGGRGHLHTRRPARPGRPRQPSDRSARRPRGTGPRLAGPPGDVRGRLGPMSVRVNRNPAYDVTYEAASTNSIGSAR